jgi:hypothetical protein
MLAATLLAVAPPASAADAAPTISALTLSPTKTTGVATEGRVLGPFALRNGTNVTYDVTVGAVLLGQRPSGAVLVRDDPASRRAAARMIGLQARRFTLPAGRTRSVAGVVKHVGSRHGIYAGILFSARPRRRAAAGAQITNVLRINAGQFLAPRQVRAAFATGAIRAEQAAPQKLRLQVPVANRGNILGRITGHVDVRDAGGRRVLRAPVTRTGIVPGASVDVPAPLSGRLGRGRYTLEAKLVSRGRTLRARGTMELFGINTIRSEDARLTSFDSPHATKGSPVEIRARYRNTGNVDFAPGARIDVRAIGAGGVPAASPLRSESLDVTTVAPGREGRIRGSIQLPEGREFELTLHLMAGDRELGVQAVRVEVRERPSLADRLEAFLRTNALAIIAAAFGLLLVGAVLTVRYVLRLKARIRTQ